MLRTNKQTKNLNESKRLEKKKALRHSSQCNFTQCVAIFLRSFFLNTPILSNSWSHCIQWQQKQTKISLTIFYSSKHLISHGDHTQGLSSWETAGNICVPNANVKRQCDSMVDISSASNQTSIEQFKMWEMRPDGGLPGQLMYISTYNKHPFRPWCISAERQTSVVFSHS